MKNIDKITKRNIKRQKLIDKIQEREDYIEEHGYQEWLCNERKRSINKIFIIAIALPFIYVFANFYYFIFELIFSLLILLFKNDLTRSDVQRDDESILYQNYYLKSKKIKVKLPFVMFTYAAPKEFKSKNIMY